jgi:catechol 2,3-dioxygenase-like lactoylglutathione lyase family enzyme
MGNAAPLTTITLDRAVPILRVQDIDASVSYYLNILGFQVDWSPATPPSLAVNVD